VTGRGGGVDAAGWDRRRLLTVLAIVLAAGLLLLAGLGYAVYLAAWSAGPPGPGRPAGTPGPGTTRTGEDRRDRIAAAPMLRVDPTASRPTAPAPVPGPVLTVPPATTAGPVRVPSGFPRTPAGAVGQLAAIETTVLQAMSIPLAHRVYRAWALPGGTGPGGWELTGNVRAFLGAAGMGAELDPAATVVATPAAGQVKGTDGPGWTLACVLLEVEAIITTHAGIGYGHCERMQWQAGRWMIGPGAPPAAAPSTWPGSEPSVRAGWRTWAPPGPV
jgi:hypothetical protein